MLEDDGGLYGAGGSDDSEKLGIGLDGIAAEAFGVVGLSGSSMVGGWIIGGRGGGGIATTSCCFFDPNGLAFLATPLEEGRNCFVECPFSCILGATSS